MQFHSLPFLLYLYGAAYYIFIARNTFIRHSSNQQDLEPQRHGLYIYYKESVEYSISLYQNISFQNGWVLQDELLMSTLSCSGICSLVLWQLEITIGENVIEILILHKNYRGVVFALTHLTEAFR